MAPKCSIVIRAYNEETGINRLLKGITQQVYEGYEIILVDSGSTDRTVEVAKGFDARLVNNGHSKGMGYGLFSIRERLKHVGGMVEIQSEPGCGTRVILLAPSQHANHRLEG